MGTVECWRNAHMGGWARRIVWLREDQGRWSVEVKGPVDREEVLPQPDEAAARAELARQLVEGEDWRRVDQLSRRPSGPDADHGVDRPLGG